MNYKTVILLSLVVLLTAGAAMAEKIAVGVAWDKKSGMSEQVLKGLQEGLAALKTDIELEICKETGVGQPFADTVKRFEAEKKAMVLMRSDAVKYLAKNPPAIPAFIGACNNPVQLGLMKSLDEPDGNVTGVTYALCVEAQFQTFVTILPEMKSVMLLCDKNHAGTAIDRRQTKDACAKYNLEYKEAVCENKDQLLQAIADNKATVSIFIIGSQSLVMDNTRMLVDAAPDKPFLSYSSKPVKDGALCGFAADDVRLGKLLAQSLVDVLVNGKPMKEVPVKTDGKPKLYISKSALKQLGARIPLSILKVAQVVE